MSEKNAREVNTYMKRELEAGVDAGFMCGVYLGRHLALNTNTVLEWRDHERIFFQK